jgi:hypothetical protein
MNAPWDVRAEMAPWCNPVVKGVQMGQLQGIGRCVRQADQSGLPENQLKRKFDIGRLRDK